MAVMAPVASHTKSFPIRIHAKSAKPDTSSFLTRSVSYGASHTKHSWWGLVVLTEEAFQNEFGLDAALWSNVISRLYTISPAVHAAVACLGAAYESLECCIPSERSASDSSLEYLYATSLLMLQEEIEATSCGPLPLFFASIVLAGVELLLSNQNNALLHVQGAFQVSNCIPLSASPGKPGIQAEEQLAVASIVQALDVQIASYALARPLDLPPFSADEIVDRCDPALSSTQRIRSQVLSLLHNCYHFAIQASKFKYVHYSHLPLDIAIDQGSHIALLSNWIKVLREIGKTDLITGPGLLEHRLDARQRCILSLRLQCLSALIYLSTILCPYETSYDAFTSSFDEIIQIACLLLQQDITLPRFVTGRRLRLLSSLSQPLFFAAMKCRVPGLRRKAAELLAMTGQEGPWDSQVLTCVLSRAITIEELSESPHVEETGQSPNGTEDSDSPTFSTSIHIPGTSRLHGCGMEIVSPDRSKPNQQRGKRMVKIGFSRCLDVECMVKSTEGPNPKAFEDERHWQIWDEVVEL